MKNSTTATKSLTVGIDLGDKSSIFTIINDAGEMIEQGKIATTPEGFMHKFGTCSPLRIAFETGTHSPWINDLLVAQGHETIVANSRKLQLISKSTHKNDKNDSVTLARLARIDPQMLSPVRHRDVEVRKDLAVLRVRNNLVGSRSSQILSIRFICKSFGYRLPTCSTDSFANQIPSYLPEELRPLLEPQLKVIECITGQIKEMDWKLKQLATEKYPVTRLLQQIHGVGPVTALCYVLVIADPKRFPRGRNVASYIGLTPRQHQSGERDPSLPISKAGDECLRRLLVQCSQHIMGQFGQDSDLRRHGERILERNGASAKKRAVIAVARKLAVVMHHLWLTGEEYQPLWQSEQKQVA